MKALWEPLGNNHFSRKIRLPGQAAGRRLISGAAGLMVPRGSVVSLVMWFSLSVPYFSAGVRKEAEGTISGPG